VLYLTPKNGTPIPLRSLAVARSFNKPHIWRARPANWIAAGHAIETGAATWSVGHEQFGALRDELTLVSHGGGSSQGSAEGGHCILLSDAEIPGGEARYHLHKDYQHLLGLLQASPLSRSVLITDPDTLNYLEAFTAMEDFGGGETPTSLARYVIQTGSTDLSFIRQILGQWNRTHPDKRMVLSYGPPWLIVGSWARDQVPGDALTIQEDAQIHGWSELPSFSGNLVSAPMITYQLNKLFEIGQWNETNESSLPHYLERSGRIFTVGSRRDTFSLARDGTQNLEWKADLFCCAEDWPIEDHPLVQDGFAAGYRIASGLVETCDQKSVTVTLDGCSQDQATVVCHLTTLSTGPDRARGIHMPPYPQARVMVAVPAGLFTGPPFLLGDVRESDAPGIGPSIIFEAPIQMVGPKIEITNNKVSVILDGVEAKVGSA
jgi:hypothetical protein